MIGAVQIVMVNFKVHVGLLGKAFRTKSVSFEGFPCRTVFFVILSQVAWAAHCPRLLCFLLPLYKM